MFGWCALIASFITAGSLAMMGVTSFTAFDPAEWVRIASMVPFPFALVLSVACGIAALRKKVDRAPATIALVIDTLSIVAFIVMLFIGG